MYSRVFDRTLYLIGHYAGAVIFQVKMYTPRATRATRSVFLFQCCFVVLLIVSVVVEANWLCIGRTSCTNHSIVIKRVCRECRIFVTSKTV